VPAYALHILNSGEDSKIIEEALAAADFEETDIETIYEQ
jgi:site-specific recombinase XerD